MTERNDAELVADALGGDTSAIGAIYARYADRIYSFSLSRLHNGEQAADATHETFVRAAQRLSTLREPSRLRPWLFAIARNQIVDQARLRERSTALEAAGDVVADLPDHDADLVSAESASLLWEAAGSLQERDLDLLELQLREGLEGPDLADALGVTNSHLHVLQSRMKDRIERALGSLLIARHGRDDCDPLQVLLSDWDGRFTLAVRSRVTRHVESCETCQETRTAVLVPGRFLGMLPLMAAPLALRTRTASAMESALGGGGAAPVVAATEWTWRDDGFPDAVATGGRKSGMLWWVAAALLMLAGVAAIAGGVWYLTASDDDDGETVAVGDGGDVTEAPAAAPTPESSEVLGANAATEPTANPQTSATPTPFAIPIPTPTPLPAGEADPPAAEGGPPSGQAAPPSADPPAPAPADPPASTPIPMPTPLTPGSVVLDAQSLAFGLADQAAIGLTNPGDLPADWSSSVTPPFAVSAGGQLPGGGLGQLLVTVNRSGQNDGTLNGTITVTTPGGPIDVPITALVDSPPIIRNLIPAQSTVICGNSVGLTVEAADTLGIASVTVSWTVGSTSGGPVALGGSAPIFSGAVGPFTEDGPVAVTAVVTDAAGQTASQSAQLFVSVRC